VLSFLDPLSALLPVVEDGSSWSAKAANVIEQNPMSHFTSGATLIVRLLISLVLLSCLLIGQACAQQPNILLVIADDLGSDSLDLFLGNSGPPTPTLDSLANAGVRFSNCWGSPTCSPARAQILTGRYGFRTGVGTVGSVPSLDEGTVAQAFKAAGYATGCLGKWHLADATNGNRSNPNLMGFDHYSGSLGGGVPDYFSWTKVQNGAVANGPNNLNTNYVTSETATDASNWIAQQGNNPWFCWVAFNAPHTPLHSPPSNLHTSSLLGTEADILANPRDYYLAMVEAMDTEIGRMLSEMDPAVRANTVVVFVGDNGTPTNVTPTPRVHRGSKGTLFEGGVNIPCMVSGASVVSPGRTHDGLVSLVDVFTTLLDLAGLDASFIPNGAAIDSRSFAPYVTDPNASIIHTCQFSEQFSDPSSTPGNSEGKTVKLGDWKLIRFDDGDESFYNLPNENSNLADGSLTSTEQTNYDALNSKLDSILANPLLGDVDLSGVVDFSDIPAFISVLIAGDYQVEADCNEDRLVDFADIESFVAILQSQ
jgi:arylsulfatase A-like enzyme